MPRFAATVTAWVRSATSSFKKIVLRCALPVSSASPQLGGDLLVDLSHRDGAQHCHLAFGQRVISDVRGNFTGDVAMNVAAATMHIADGLEHFRARAARSMRRSGLTWSVTVVRHFMRADAD